jgi:DNA invertase Pin-like site-specific DNA recombinase
VVGRPIRRSLIAERVRAGIRNARAKGKLLGRPSAKVSDLEIQSFLKGGASMAAVAEKLGVSTATVWRRAKLV